MVPRPVLSVDRSDVITQDDIELKEMYQLTTDIRRQF